MKLAVNTLVLTVAALLALGVVMLYSASMTQVGAKYLVMQGVWAALGLVAMFTMAMVDYQLLKRYWLPLVILTGVLLLAVFVPHIGRASHGAHRWIGLGRFNFQPSELGKLALIVMVAWYAEKKSRKFADPKWGILVPGLLIGPLLGLIFIEPDRGTTILMAAVIASMLLIAGARWYYIIGPVVLGAILLGISFYHDPMRSARIYSWQHVEETRLEKGCQAYQAWLAFGSGGVTGTGLGNGRQTLGNWVPEQHTDFILAAIGEQLGLVATTGVVIAFIAFVWAGLFIALHARDTFGTLVASGITLLIGFQAFINMGVATSFLPNKGLALPFISYGGSSLLMTLAFVGVLLSIARQAHAHIPSSAHAPDEDNPFAPAR